MSPVALDRRGLWIAVAAFVIWGLMPLYWHLLRAVPSLQIVLHRAVWCAVLVAAWLTLREGRGWLRAVIVQPRLAGMLALSGTLIAFNWGLYVWAVNSGHVIEASLGYFINPLLNVLIGVLFLRERLSRPQWIAVALAGCGVAWLTAGYGRFPWIALCLAGSFALYGVIRKFAAVEAVRGLGGTGGFFSLRWGGWTDVLLVLGGALTAIPLIFFAYAVRRVPLSVVGLLQYLGPTLQLLLGVFFFGEAFGVDRAAGFAFIWAGLAIFAFDGVRAARRRIVAQQA
jgi:chloramphenicol-sensitive protein RarD